MHNKRAIRMTYRKILLIGLVLGLAIGVFPIVLRAMTNFSVPGDEAYYHMTVVDSVIKGDFFLDVHTGGLTLISSYDIFLILFHSLGTYGYFASSLLVGMLTILCFYFLLRQVKMEKNALFFSLIVFVLSPISVYSLFIANAFSFYLLLSLAGFVLMKRFSIISTVLYFICAVSSPVVGLMNLIILGCYMLYSKSNGIAALIGNVLGMAGNLVIIAVIGMPQIPDFISRNILQDMLSEIGGKTALSFFALLLFAFGIYYSKDKKKKIWPVYACIILLGLLSLYFVKTNMFLNVIISAIAGYGLSRLYYMEWSSSFMRKVVIFSIIAGIIFSAYSHAVLLADEAPSAELLEGLESLKGEPDGKVLAHHSLGHIIREVSEKQVILDSDLLSYYDINQRYNESMQIFLSRNLRDTRKLMDDLDVNYIVIEPGTKDMIWEKEDQGLLYLFRNNETFNNIYSRDSIEVWEVRQ